MEGFEELKPICKYEESCTGTDYRNCGFRKDYLCPREPEDREAIERLDISETYLDR